MLGTPSKAEVGVNAIEFLDKAKNPSGYTCFDEFEISSLSRFKKSCDRDRDELLIFKKQYDTCMSGAICEELKTDNQIAFYSTMITAFVFGFLIGGR